MPVLRRKFGRKLRQTRVHRGLSQEQFAELIGVCVDFLSLIERGINAPSFERLELMAERLKVQVADLFQFEDEETKG